MRSILFCGLVGFAAGGCATTPGSDDAFSPTLAKYEHVFNGSPDNNTLPDTGKADGSYPAKSTELIAMQSPVKDQDRRGVCTIFTTTALMEHLYIKAGMMKPSFSEQYLQWSVKDQLGVLPESEGSNISDNVEAIAQFGIPDEAADPYNGKQWTAANDPDCKITGEEGQSLPGKCWTQGDPPASAKMAKMYFLPRGKFLNTKSIKEHITTKHTAVGVGIDFFYQAWNHGASTLPINRDEMTKGIVRYPNQTDITESHKQRAGHGILIVGWDADMTAQKVDKDDKPMVDAQGKPIVEKGFYIFKNSWGTEIFGVTNPNGAGYGYISQKYIEDYGTAYITDVPALDQGPATP